MSSFTYKPRGGPLSAKEKSKQILNSTIQDIRRQSEAEKQYQKLTSSAAIAAKTSMEEAEEAAAANTGAAFEMRMPHPDANGEGVAFAAETSIEEGDAAAAANTGAAFEMRMSHPDAKGEGVAFAAETSMEEEEAAASASNTGAASQIDCFLDKIPEDSIETMLLYLLERLGWSRPEATSVPDDEDKFFTKLQRMLPVLLISLHGGLPVLRSQRNARFSYNYKTFLAKSWFKRLIKTPSGCCSLILPEVRQKYLDVVLKILKTSSISGASIEDIKKALLELSFDLQGECLKLKRTETITQSIFECRSRAFEIVDTEKGHKVINKLWTTDTYKQNDEKNLNEGEQGHKLAPRGILFCNDVVIITLPNNWSPSKYNMRRFGGTVPGDKGTYTFKGKKYAIGIYTPGTPGTFTSIKTPGTITYREKTNLLSCPYFMQFASEQLGDNIITLNNSLSLGQNNKGLIPMVTQITAEVLYGFLCNQEFLSIDMSCESLMIYDKDGNYIQNIARAQLKTPEYYDELQKLYNILKKGELHTRGGNRKTRYNPKKYKTKKYKKRGNTKTKRSKKRNISQKKDKSV